ncbi:MAG: hypothetical protein GPJ03_14060 [Microcystis aeruginosa G13-01]|nr:hypothetical protein [Microcystis aeruginosa SX13-01]NCS35549.1 hypothetical protein [Microcystis aeruginosa G11-01]NCT64087.1 hypothetical protein [Microcystis aeruginosa G13-01]
MNYQLSIMKWGAGIINYKLSIMKWGAGIINYKLSIMKWGVGEKIINKSNLLNSES